MLRLEMIIRLEMGKMLLLKIVMLIWWTLKKKRKVWRW